MKDSSSGIERVPSGIVGLDTILGGGFLRGGLYIVQGPPGTGKTTFGNQISFHHVAGGGRALFITLLAEFHARMMQHMATMAFFDATKIPDQLTYLNGLQVLHEKGLPGLLELLRREIMASGASLLVLDGVASASRLADGDQTFNEFVHQLQGVAIATDCTMFMLNSSEGPTTKPEQTMVDGIIDLNDDLVGWSARSTLQIVKFRGSGFLRGRHAFRITGQGIIVYPRIEELLARPSRLDPDGFEKVSSGVPQLDVMLGGGLPASSTTMVMGASGIGKTTLGLSFLATSSNNEPGLLFGFIETPARLAAKMDRVCPKLRPLLDSGVVEVVWQPPTDGLLDGYGDRLLQAVRRRKVRRLFIDGLNGFENAANDPARMERFLTALTNELRVLGVTTLYTMEVADIMGPSIRAPIGDLSSLAENLLLMRFVEVRSRLYRLLSILKVRDSDFDPTLHEFTITKEGLVIEKTPKSAEAITAGASPRRESEGPPRRRVQSRRRK